MATIFSATEGISVRKIVSRPKAGIALVLFEDGTVRRCGMAKHVSSPDVLCAPPLPPGVSYVDIESADRGDSSDGFFSAKLSDGAIVHWGLEHCWSSNNPTRVNYRGQRPTPMTKYLTDRGVVHAGGMRVIVGKGGFHRIRDDQENYTWFDTGSEVSSIKCDIHGNIVVFLEDGRIHHEGSDLLKLVDPDWRYRKLVEVEEGPHAAMCIAGITRSGMAVQLTAEVKNFPSSEMGDAALILPVPIGVVEAIRSIQDRPITSATNRTVKRPSRRTYETTVRLPPEEGHPGGMVVKVCHLAPKTYCAASRLPNIIGGSAEEGAMRVNYSAFVAGSKSDDWVQMMVEAAANDPNVIPWLPGSLRKHPRLRGLQGLLKV